MSNDLHCPKCGAPAVVGERITDEAYAADCTKCDWQEEWECETEKEAIAHHHVAYDRLRVRRAYAPSETDR